MENCTIYSHQLKFDEIVNIIKSHLPKAKIEFNDGGKQKGLVATVKGGFFGKDKILTVNYRERENPSYKLDQVECGLTQNLAGMVNYIQSLPASNPALRNKFLHKVMAANCEMPFITEPDFNEDFEGILKQIAKATNAFIFTGPNRIFNRSGGQHFVDQDFNLILDTDGKMEVDDIDVVVDAKYHDGPTDSYSEEQLKRKANSESFLSSHGIKTNTNLPCLAESGNTTLRTTEEVVNRIYALLAVSVLGEGLEKEKVEQLISAKSIQSFTPKEQSILEPTELDDQQRAYATWRYESLYTLLWAVNIFPDLKYASDICDVSAVVSTIFKPTRAEFEQQAQLRSTEEVLNELDKTYRMNWACVDARIKNAQVSGSINSSVVYERHYALNWLTNYQDQAWDNVQTNT